MKFKYLPNTLDLQKITDKYTEEKILELQLKYRNLIEQIISNKIDLKAIDSSIAKTITIPTIEDQQYNFYHHNSNLNSDYIFLRNNIHIERLSEEELSKLEENKTDENYVLNTFSKVLFEDGDQTFYGLPSLPFLGSSKNIILEFSYDLKKVKALKEVKYIKSIEKEIKEKLESITILDTPITVIIYNGIPDIYRNEEELESK